MSKPARPELKFQNFEEMLADAQKLAEGAYVQGGKWDLPMILDHLAKTMGGPFRAGTKNLPWPLGPVARFFVHRIAQRETYPNIKFPAPRMVRPVRGMSLDAAMAEFVQSIRLVEAVAGPTIESPPFGTVPLDDFRRLQLLHGAHHLSFLKV